LSRIDGIVWRDKPLLLMATSPGARGGQTVLDIAAARFPYMGAKITGALSVPSFYDNFKGGVIVNKEIKENLLLEVSKFQKEI